MIFKSSRTSLLIDPNSNASLWLKKNLQQKGPIEVLNHQDPKFNNQLELAMRFGKTLIIQEIDNIDPMLFPIFRKDLIHQGSRQIIQIGNKQVDYSPDFRQNLIFS